MENLLTVRCQKFSDSLAFAGRSWVAPKTYFRPNSCRNTSELVTRKIVFMLIHIRSDNRYLSDKCLSLKCFSICTVESIFFIEQIIQDGNK